jgi:hypothetical protein
MTQDLVDAANALAEVLVRENAALKRLDFAAAVALGQAKEAALLGVTKGRAVLPVTQRTPTTMALGRRINELVAENRTLLERAIAVQTRVVAIVARAVTPPPAMRQYAASGFKTQPRRAPAMALSARA